MKSTNIAFRDIRTVLLGQILCCAAMTGVFAALGRYDTAVLLGSIVGGTVAFANFFFMSLFANMAADKAEQQDVAGGQKLITLSYSGRMAAMFLVLALCAKSGAFHVLTLVLPLAFTRPILTVAELFKKKGEDKT